MSKTYLGKTIIVTGARKGIGKILAEYFLEEGATVIGISRQESSINHSSYNHISLDITKGSEVQSAFTKIGKEFKKIDILVNNAAVLTSQYSLIMSEKNARDMIETNVLGTFFVSKECAKIMIKNKSGRIINIGSMASALEPMGDAVYAASKSAVITLANVLAKEFSHFNVTCNTLAITAFETDMMKNIPKEKLDQIIKALPVPRYAKIEDIINVVDFFSSERSDYITAQTLFLGGVH
jgi:3-oxoacyl-[acyl-carrier protein] reductase